MTARRPPLSICQLSKKRLNRRSLLAWAISWRPSRSGSASSARLSASSASSEGETLFEGEKSHSRASLAVARQGRSHRPALSKPPAFLFPVCNAPAPSREGRREMVLAAPMRASAVALQACSDFLRFAFNAPKGSNKRCQKALSIINATMRRGRAQRVGDRVRTSLTVQHSVPLGSQCRPRRRSAAIASTHGRKYIKASTTSKDAGT